MSEIKDDESGRRDEEWFRKQVPWFQGDYFDSSQEWLKHNHELRIKEEQLEVG